MNSTLSNDKNTDVGMIRPASLQRRGGRIQADTVFRAVTLVFGIVVFILIAWIGLRLFQQSALTRRTFGWSFLSGDVWDVPRGVYGIRAFIYGTAVSSLLALVIAVPIGVGSALFLAEVAPRWIAGPISFLIELIAAVPSVIFGLWGFLVLCPWMQQNLNPWLVSRFGSIPLFEGPAFLTNMLAAGIILAIMILPFITSISREVIRAVPQMQREAALGLGATKWETMRSVVLKGARSGIIGSAMLALGRAIGETMAVVMVIGNTPQISRSLLQPGYSMPSLLANQFNEAYNDDLQLSALLEVAFLLFGITLAINVLARGLIILTTRSEGARSAVQGSRAAEGFRAATGAILGTLPRAAVAFLALMQVVSDFRRHGAGALLGPVEIALVIYGVCRLITAKSRGTRFWNRWRQLNNVVMHVILSLCALIGCVALGLVLGYVAYRGLGAFSLRIFTELPLPPGMEGGGLKNAIAGTLVLVGIGGAFGIPMGVIGGIYLSEFGRTRFGGVVRFAADVLNGIPSVVIGLFAYAAFVLPVKHFSALAGGAALGIMMIPTIMRTTEEMLKMVPVSFREASLGLGATHFRTIWSVVLPAVRSGVVTGVMLATARIAGETAPLLFTAFGNDEFSTKLNAPISSLTMKIYQYAISPYNDWIDQAWAGAVVLLIIVFVFSLAARLAARSRYAAR